MEESLTVTSNRNNPLKTFFASIAETVLTFPLDLVLKTKKEVLNVVSRMECEMQQRESQPSSSSPSHDFVTSFQTDGMLQSPQPQAFTSCRSMTQSSQAQVFPDCNDITNSSQDQQYTDSADFFSLL